MGEGAKRVTTLISGAVAFQKRARGSTAVAFSPSRALRDVWALQRDRWILWAPVGVIAGAALWLTAAQTPPPWIGATVLVAGAWPGRSPPGPALIHDWALGLRRALAGLCVLMGALGLSAGAAVATRSWPRRRFQRLMDRRMWKAGSSASIPAIRASGCDCSFGTSMAWRGAAAMCGFQPDAGLLAPGRAARCRAVLGPPSAPLAPLDFAQAWFERLGATGFSLGRCRAAAFDGPPGWMDRQRLLLAAARYDLSGVIQRAAPGRGGAIAAALVTGDRSPIDPATNEALWASGLGHLLSVSGIHMGVVGGLVFAVLLWTLSLIGPIALRFPVKKLAAIGAACGWRISPFRTSVPALRAFVMACVAFGAISPAGDRARPRWRRF